MEGERVCVVVARRRGQHKKDTKHERKTERPFLFLEDGWSGIASQASEGSRSIDTQSHTYMQLFPEYMHWKCTRAQLWWHRLDFFTLFFFLENWCLKHEKNLHTNTHAKTQSCQEHAFCICAQAHGIVNQRMLNQCQNSINSSVPCDAPLSPPSLLLFMHSSFSLHFLSSHFPLPSPSFPLLIFFLTWPCLCPDVT